MAGITQRITFSQILLREGNPFCNDKLLECCAGHGLKISTNIVSIVMELSGDGRKGQITGQILVDIGDGTGDHSGHEHKVMQTAGSECTEASRQIGLFAAYAAENVPWRILLFCEMLFMRFVQ
ncbi:MAG: hypothetical protein ACI4F8_06035 [Lachnospiraceae bacterium]